MTKSKNLGLNLPSRDNTTDLADINVISGNFETIDNEFEEVYNKLSNTGVVNTVSGNPVVLKDSANAPLQNLKLFGKTTQNGTPTPDAPVPLVSVGDSGSFEVGVYRENLIPYPYYDTTKTENGITFTVNSDGTITVNGTATATTFFRLARNLYLPEGHYYINDGVNRADAYCRFNVTSSNQNFWWGSGAADVEIRISAGATLNNVVFKPQIESGTQATPYEPFTKQTLTMPYTLPSIPNTNTRDEVDFGKGVHRKKAELFTFDGSENWVLTTSGTRKFVVNGIYAKRGIGVSSHFTQAVETDLCFWVSGINSSLRPFTIYDKNSKWADLDAFKTWLSENKPTFLLELETPIETPLTETELNAYRQLMTNKGTTTIVSEADMSVEYIADTKLYIDNKLAELTALVLEG